VNQITVLPFGWPPVPRENKDSGAHEQAAAR